MIGYVEGTVRDRGENWLLLLAGAVGYKIFVTADTLLAAREGTTVRLFCHHHFSQEGQALYGFVDKRELELFEHLIAVTGVGPKGALTILSKAKAAEVEEAIIRADATLLTAISGVGKKKADRLIVELKPKLAGRVGKAMKEAGDSRKIVAALEGLGYRREEILDVVRNIPHDVQSDTERIKWALRHLYR